MTQEKRAHPRIAAALTAQLEHAGKKFELPVRDISQGGVFVLGLNADAGDSVSLEVKVPPMEAALKVKAEVVRLVMAPDGGNILGAGLQFEALDATQSK